MRNLKPIIVLSSVLFVMVLMVPTLLVIPFSDKGNGQLAEELQNEQEVKTTIAESPIDVAVYRAKQDLVENIPLEEYVVGVVASEMPATFELEALKAQALAARTYILRHLLAEERLGTTEEWDVSDTVTHQVYKGHDELKAQWKENYASNLSKVTEAVKATAGKILTYNNEPITAQYFSTSNGKTENSEEYWQDEIPYLRSVESPWDINTTKFLDQVTLSVKDFEGKLGVQLGGEGAVGKVISRTTGNRVDKVDVNGKQFTGREVRDLLSLQSSDFTWERKGDNIVITTKGYGHGVGMSQYGANGMALEGKTHSDIIAHYYKDVEIGDADQHFTKLTAKQ